MKWSSPSRELSHRPGELHIWRARLEQTPSKLIELASLLDVFEQERATRFHFQRLRDRFVAGRGILRVLLGRYLHQPASEILIGYGPRGKPFLTEAQKRLYFNMAHSRQLALYAFAERADVGVDLEFVRPMPDASRLAARYFSVSENEAWKALPAKLRLAGFFACWTRKEAFIKAVGEGLSYPLDRFSVAVHPQQPARLIAVDGDADKAREWTICALEPSPDYAAAVAVRGVNWQLRCWDFSWSPGAKPQGG